MSVEVVRHVVDPQRGMEIMDVKDSHGREAQFQCGILPGNPEPSTFFQKCIDEFAEQENQLKEHIKKFKPKTLLAMLMFFLLAPLAHAAPGITVSASAVTILGTTQSISITVQLIDPLNTGMLKVSGTGIVPIMRASTVTPGTTATVGPIYGNDVILNGFGNANTTYYEVQVFTVSGGFISSTPALQNFYAFTGSGTIDLATATPLVPNFMNSTAGVNIPGSLTVGGVGVALKPAASDKILFISPAGNSLQDGKSFGSAYWHTDLGTSINDEETALGGPGQIVVSPQSYSNATTILCASNVRLNFAGVKITYTGSGTLFNVSSSGGNNLQNCKITGPLQLLGSQTSGTIAINVGNPVATQGLTLNSYFDNITIGDGPFTGAIHGFGIGVKVDGNTNSGTYYTVFHNVASTGNLNQGWMFVPTLNNRANSGRCIACTAIANGAQGFDIDGANDWSFLGIDTEGNGTYGIDFPGTQVTQSNFIAGGDVENNTTSDIHCGSSSNVILTTIVALNLADATKFTGSCGGAGNKFAPAQVSGGGTWTFGCSFAGFGSNYCFKAENEEGGTAAILGVIPTSANAGQVILGSPEYPAVFPSGLAKFNSSGGGVITHVAPNTSSNFTITDPAATGTTSLSQLQTSAATNFGTALTTQTIVASASGPTPFNVTVSAIVTLAGTGCSAASNTVTPTVNWTAPGGTAESLGLNAVSITGNGPIDSQNTTVATTMVTVVPKAGTAITYTTASALASTGCSPVPQYTVFAKASQ